MTLNLDAFTNELGSKMASRERKVVLFLGAGSSCACGLPDLAGLTAAIKGTLKPPETAFFDQLITRGNLESALSRLRRIAALLPEPETQQIDGLTGTQAAELDLVICQAIVEVICKTPTDMTAVNDLATWIKGCSYERAIEVFTINYDPLLERAFEAKNIPFFDGFLGTFEAKFFPDLVSSGSTIPQFFTRLWKLHGSTNWAWRDSKIVRLGTEVSPSDVVAIYPSDEKYSESRRVPFVVLQDSLRTALCAPECVTIISGYSFSDQHINELIFEAAASRPRSEFIVFCFDKIPDEVQKHALAYRNIQVLSADGGIVSGREASWDSPSNDRNNEIWDGDHCKLGDFAALARFLSTTRTPMRPIVSSTNV